MKDTFYSEQDEIGPRQKERIWRAIEEEISRKPRKRNLTDFIDRQSFLYGIAATIVFFFAGFGVYSAVQKAIFSSKPDEVKMDAAYRSAIREFEKILPYAERAAQKNTPYDILTPRKEQLAMLNSEIHVLQNDLRNGDISRLKQEKLRELYKMKLQILIEMIDGGEIEL